MKYNFVTVGGATRDISFFTDQGVPVDNRRDLLRQKLLGFECGAKIKVDRFHYSFGGGAANAAVCLANFGLKTACLAAVGTDDAGRQIAANLKAHRIDTGALQEIKGAESGSSFVLVSPDGDRIIFGARGANASLTLEKSGRNILEKADAVYVASLSGSWEKVLAGIFDAAPEARVYWNPGATQYRRGLKKLAPYLRRTEAFFLNKDEATELLMDSEEYGGRPRSFYSRVDNLLKAIKSFGPRLAVVTMGEDGVAAYDGKKIVRRKSLGRGKFVDTTGIGDVFNSTLAGGLEIYEDLDKALDLALRNAAAKVKHLGAQEGLLGKESLK